MSEIDDPIPREHTGCIVRAGLLIKRIMKLQEAQELLDLGGVEALGEETTRGPAVLL